MQKNNANSEKSMFNINDKNGLSNILESPIPSGRQGGAVHATQIKQDFLCLPKKQTLCCSPCKQSPLSTHDTYDT